MIAYANKYFATSVKFQQKPFPFPSIISSLSSPYAMVAFGWSGEQVVINFMLIQAKF